MVHQFDAMDATSSAGAGNGSDGSVSAATVAAALAQVHSMQAHALAAVVSTANNNNSSSSSSSGGSGSADIDSLLTPNTTTTTNGNGADAATLATPAAVPLQQPRRAFEPYEHRRAHDLRAECYRRGLRPIKKGPHANDNKGGYIALLRQDDSAALSASSLVVHSSQESALLASNGISSSTNATTITSSTMSSNSMASDCGPERLARRHDRSGDDEQELASATKKRKLQSGLAQSQQQQHARCDGTGSSGTSSPTSAASSSESTGTGAGPDSAAATAAAATPGVADFTSFYESGQAALQYASSLPKQPANPTTDLEILSGIANTYTQNANSSSESSVHQPPPSQQLCTSCRTVVSDQLLESMRLGKSKLERLATEQRERDTVHLQLVLRTLAELRQTYRQTATDASARSRDVLAELDDDIAFFVLLKERAKERMRLAMQAESSSSGSRGSSNQAIGGSNNGSSGGAGGSSSAASGAV